MGHESAEKPGRQDVAAKERVGAAPRIRFADPKQLLRRAIQTHHAPLQIEVHNCRRHTVKDVVLVCLQSGDLPRMLAEVAVQPRVFYGNTRLLPYCLQRPKLALEEAANL
ncbi:MAG: hypothetical protein HW416_1958 [Chloroflexi bacterium]|nr:hypothetical protein [Chloroflexota bacterium]